MTQQPPPTDPLRNPATMILELTNDQAQPFAGLGECFAIVGRGSYPGHVGRLCLYAVPVSKELATAACKVAMGEARAVKLKAVSVEPRATLPPCRALPLPPPIDESYHPQSEAKSLGPQPPLPCAKLFKH